MLFSLTAIREAPSHSKNTHSFHSKIIDCFTGKFFSKRLFTSLYFFAMMKCCFGYEVTSLTQSFPVVSPFSLRGSLPLGIVFTKFKMQSYHMMLSVSEEPKKEQAVMRTVTFNRPQPQS